MYTVHERLKKNYFIKFLSPLPLKKYFLFLSFSLSLSLFGFSSFFLFPSHVFFLSLIYSLLPVPLYTNTSPCPMPTEAPVQRRRSPQLHPLSFCYLMPSVDMGLYLAFSLSRSPPQRPNF